MALIRQHYDADKEKLQKIRVLLVRPGTEGTWELRLGRKEEKISVVL